MNHLSEDDLVLHYYGEESPRADRHLRECESCREAYQALQRVLNSVDSLPVPEREADYEARLWRSIGPRLARRRFPLAWRWWMVAAAMAALIVAAFFAGRRFEHPRQIASSPDPQARERVLLVALGDHLERSQMMLIELANAGAPNSGRVDISYEQRTAEDLLESNRLYRQTASSSGDAATAALLDDLERVLLEIAHSPSAVSAAQLDDLRKRIEDRGILFKVKIFGSQVEQREVDRKEIEQSRNKS